MPTVEQLVMVAEVSLLESGGVDSWDWYSASLEDYGYVKSDDIFEDAENLLDALKGGGVSDWDWYGDSIAGLNEYEEYLESLPDLDDALDIMSWKMNKPVEVVVAPVVEEVVEEVVEKRRPVGVAEEKLFAHIVSRFGDDRAEDIYELAVEKGVWKQTTFPKEFKKALKVIVKGLMNPLEFARQALVASVIKNGKLDVFLDEIVEV